MEVLMSGSKMRLNEKNVINFATCNSPVDKEGWLLKKAPDAASHARGFQKRYFSLKGNLLFYFDKKGDKEPLGVIIMEGCTVELVEVPDQAYTFGIHFQGPSSRTYILGAEDQEVMESWMKVLSCATYEYMRLMVAELQRQLDDINATERAKAKQLKEAAAAAKSSPQPQANRQPPQQQQSKSPHLPTSGAPTAMPRSKTGCSSRTDSSLSMGSSTSDAGLEEDDFFAASPSSMSSASSTCQTPPKQQQQQQLSPRLTATTTEKSSATSNMALKSTTTPSLATSGVSAARRAPSPSRLNPVGATISQEISDIRRGNSPTGRLSPAGGGHFSLDASSPSGRSGGGGGGGSGGGEVIISDMHIVDPNRRSNASPSPKSFIDLHQQFGQPIVQQIQSRKSSSSALSSASSDEYY